MSQTLNNLLTLLNLEKIEEGLFRGQSEDLGLRRYLAVRWWAGALCRQRNGARSATGAFIPQLFSAAGDSQNPLSMT